MSFRTKLYGRKLGLLQVESNTADNRYPHNEILYNDTQVPIHTEP